MYMGNVQSLLLLIGAVLNINKIIQHYANKNNKHCVLYIIHFLYIGLYWNNEKPMPVSMLFYGIIPDITSAKQTLKLYNIECRFLDNFVYFFSKVYFHFIFSSQSAK